MSLNLIVCLVVEKNKKEIIRFLLVLGAVIPVEGLFLFHSAPCFTPQRDPDLFEGDTTGSAPGRIENTLLCPDVLHSHT